MSLLWWGLLKVMSECYLWYAILWHHLQPKRWDRRLGSPHWALLCFSSLWREVSSSFFPWNFFTVFHAHHPLSTHCTKIVVCICRHLAVHWPTDLLVWPSDPSVTQWLFLSYLAVHWPTEPSVWPRYTDLVTPAWLSGCLYIFVATWLFTALVVECSTQDPLHWYRHWWVRHCYVSVCLSCYLHMSLLSTFTSK